MDWLKKLVMTLRERAFTLVEMAEKAAFYFEEQEFEAEPAAKFLTPEIEPLMEKAGEFLGDVEPFDHETLYLRFDTSVSPQDPEFPDLTFSIEFEDPEHQLVSFRASEPCSPVCESLQVEPKEFSSRLTARALDIIEIAIPFELISARAGDTVSFRVALLAGAQVIEHRPVHEVLSFTIPAEDFEAEMWVTF